MDDEQISAKLAELRRERARRDALYDVPKPEWSDDDLLSELRRSFEPDPIPPCRVCGRALSVARVGGGSATLYACVGTEDDPDRPGYVRYLEGRKPGDEHYSNSQHDDYKCGGDTRVLELIRRYEAAKAPTRHTRAVAAWASLSASDKGKVLDVITSITCAGDAAMARALGRAGALLLVADRGSV